MTLCRFIILAFLLLGLFPSWSQTANNRATGDTGVRAGQETLELTTTGEITVWNGRRGVFRVYRASDGTKGSVAYAEFRSSQDAKRQIKEWLKLAQKVTSTEEKKNQSGVVVGDRIIATTQDEKSGKQEFLIIERNQLDCYLVQSSSLSVGMQVEQMIDHE